MRQGETAQVAAGMTEDYQTRPTAEEVRAVTTAIAQSKDATFYQRSIDNDRATLTGVLTGGGTPQSDRGEAGPGRRVLEGGRRDARGRVIGPPAFPEPVEIRHEQKARRVVVTWDDGHSSVSPLDYLRSWCPCAACQGHAPAAKYLDLEGQELVHVDGVGNYAISLVWADGHSTGIYSFQLLRQLCPCEACGGEKR